MRKRLAFALIVVSMSLVSACGTRLEEYQPKNAQEQEIKGLLVEFAKARNDYNVPGIVSLLADDCKINFFTRELSKSEFAAVFKAKDLEYFGQYSFTNPEIRVTDDGAVASLRYSQSLLSTGVFRFKMIRQNNCWMVCEWDASRG